MEMAFGFFKEKVRQLEKMDPNDTSGVNLAKETSDKAVEIIKELSGRDIDTKVKVIDNLIAFTNAAGGAGASTIATNVAYEAIQKGLKVVLLDLNLLCPVQHTYLGVEQQMTKPDLVGYLLGQNSLSDSIDTSNKINLIFANNRTINDLINCNDAIAIENYKDMLTKLRQFYDLVIVDCPMRIDDMLCNTTLYYADAIYMVWDEGVGSVINTEKLRRNMAATGIDSFTKMRVILNKRTSIHFSDYPLTKMNIELMGVLPFSVDIIDNSLRERIFCEKGSSSNEESNEFARKMIGLSNKILSIAGYTGK